jgi:hypothetical protein
VPRSVVHRPRPRGLQPQDPAIAPCGQVAADRRDERSAVARRHNVGMSPKRGSRGIGPAICWRDVRGGRWSSQTLGRRAPGLCSRSPSPQPRSVRPRHSQAERPSSSDSLDRNIKPSIRYILDVTSRKPASGDAKSRLLRCTLRNGRRLGPFQYGHGRIPRETADNVFVPRSTLPFRKRLGAARTIRLIGCANPARGQGPAPAARLDRSDQYGIGWRARRKSARAEPTWNAGCARGVVENHDGSGQIGRLRCSSLAALLAILGAWM